MKSRIGKYIENQKVKWWFLGWGWGYGGGERVGVGNDCKWVQDVFEEWWKCSKIIVMVAEFCEYAKTIELCTLNGKLYDI